ncbi:MAG: cytochrome c oxidase accessory protein CcoG [Sneathiella sp.]|uniref:cytochrome c oxidase accessory protein CcoG n=1 Tax=Sneathiella sp. TaxID=1964365 RepID=UPI000C4F3448|nr:cytochrome c oxidase accessory protein CcoG [Sneathiella sp.]MAZ03075.1 cytochrome c oxidase accessory protein CcoG [Sneathiella sp.]
MVDSSVENIDVRPVNKKENRSLFAKREKIQPKKARGSFRRLKWVIMGVTLAIYYITPWIRWDRGEGGPDQAVLVDLARERFYFFFIEIWPQEVYYITGLLILAAISLFLVTSLFGRAWCGYSCPQTVWTDLFIFVERMVEGDRNARLKLDKAPMSASKLSKRVLKHTIWIIIGVLTGGAWVFYFADAPTLLVELFTLQAPVVAYSSVALLTATTYVFGGLMREQVCTYMCPWPRIQGAMVDEDTLTVTYHGARGEPRGPHKKNESWEGRGHCIDCNQCVAVCPMGIDIRDGLQLECITCALCIDACNDVMDKVNLPRGLISYDTHEGQFDSNPERKLKLRFIRPRTIAYGAILALVGAIMLFTLLNRSVLDVNVIRDRNPLFVTLSDGSIRNGYTVKILNKVHETRQFRIDVEGIAGMTAWLEVSGETDRPLLVTVPADALSSYKLYVSAPAENLEEKSMDIDVIVTDVDGTERDVQETSFKGPEK